MEAIAALPTFCFERALLLVKRSKVAEPLIATWLGTSQLRQNLGSHRLPLRSVWMLLCARPCDSAYPMIKLI
jgi:hypothetical protein